jgi:hypothetical protein
MAETSPTSMTYAVYEAELFQASWDTVWRSRKLLDQTKPLVMAIEGGSVIGARVLHLGEGDPSEAVQRQSDG